MNDPGKLSMKTMLKHSIPLSQFQDPASGFSQAGQTLTMNNLAIWTWMVNREVTTGLYGDLYSLYMVSSVC